VKTVGLRLLAGLFPVVQVTSAKDRRAFTRLWHQVWMEEGNYSHPDEPVIEEFAAYDPYAVDVLVKFLGLIPAGTFRFIHYSPGLRLPALKDFEVQRVWESDRIVEATLFTVPKSFRRFLHLPALVLMRELCRYCRRNGSEGAIMMVDQRMFFALRDRLLSPIRQIGPERFYKGSITYPAYLNIEEVFRVMPSRNPFFVT